MADIKKCYRFDDIGYEGPHRGETLHQIALRDYPFLKKIQEDVEAYKTRISPKRGLDKSLEALIGILNNYVPVVNCGKCGETAYNVSLAYDYTSQGIDYSFINPDFCCDENECIDSMLNGNRDILPIRFDSILRFSSEPKYLREGMHKLLLRTITADVPKRVTRKKAEELINSLKMRGEAEQLSLFEE